MKLIKIMTLSLILSALHGSLVFADKASEKSAEELLSVMNMEVMLSNSIEQMLNMQLQQNPSMAPYKDILATFFKKHMSYESLKPDMVRIYSEAFTATELDEITTFYNTATGQKTIEKMPSLMNAGAQIGAQRIQANMAELQSMIQAESERLQQQ